MTRAVLGFAALLVLGLGVLFWFDAQQPPVAGVASGDPRVATGPRAGGGHDGPWVGGELHALQYDKTVGPGRAGRLYQFVAKDSEKRRDGVQELRDVTVDIFDPETDSVVARLHAERAEADLRQGLELSLPELPDDIALEIVHIDVNAGTRFAPLSIDMPDAIANLSTSRYRTESRADIVGTDLEASGEGLDFDMPAGRFIFLRDGTVAVETPGGRIGRVHARRELDISQPPGIGARPLRIVARERARLGVTGPEGIALIANQVELVGSADPEREGSFRYQELVATGEVLLLAEGNRFRCPLARFVLGPDGSLERVRLIGTVVGEFSIETPLSKVGSEEPRRIEVWGRGPMELRAGKQGSFDLAGPAELRWDDAVLWSEGGLRGLPQSDDVPLRFEAWAGVRVERGGWTVRTEHLEGKWREGADGASAIELIADGVASADGTGRDGQPVSLRASRGFELELSEQDWIVKRAAGVDLLAGGERPLFATADVVRDFRDDRILGATFVAEEHVEVEVDGQVLRGERLDVRGLDDLTIFGSTDVVQLDGPGLHFEAREVRRTGDTLTAIGDVVATIDRRQIALDVTAARLVASGLFDDTGASPLRLHAVGKVVADLDERGGATTIHLDTEDLEIVRQRVPGGAVEQTVVRARRGVVAELTGELGSYDLVATELDALVVERPPEDPAEAAVVDRDRMRSARGSVEARGAVRVTSREPGVFEGRGDTFFIDHEGKGRLVADPGRRMSANGVLPGSLQRFDIEASSIEFDPATLRAVEPRIHVVDPLGTALSSGSSITDLVATCRQLRATESEVVFEGDVSFLGTTSRDETWTVRCGRAVLVTDPPRNEGGAREPREIQATGGVRIVLSTGASIEGHRLTAKAFDRVVLVEGEPGPNGALAVLRQQGIDYAATWFKLDTLNGLWSNGPGYAIPSGGTQPKSDTP